MIDNTEVLPGGDQPEARPEAALPEAAPEAQPEAATAPEPTPEPAMPAGTAATPEPSAANLEAAVEAMLFVSDEPVSAAALARICDRSPSEVYAALSDLATRLEEEERGIQLREVAGGWRLFTHPAFHELIEDYVISWDTRALSQAALEALAVIAYHQPCTRQAVNGIRGVNSEAVISSLIEKGLVRENGRDPGPGSAILYATTRAFLEKFGLKSLKDLPALASFAPDEASREFIQARLTATASSVDLPEESEPLGVPEYLLDPLDDDDLELVD